MSTPWEGPKGPITDNKGPLMEITMWTMVSIATIVVSARLYTRVRYRNGPLPDDYLMAISLLSSLIATGLVQAIIKKGFGRHVYYLTLEQITFIKKINFVSFIFGAVAITLSRVSFAVSLLMLMGTNMWRRAFLWFLIAQHVAITVPGIASTIFGCRPVRKFWTPDLPATCMDPTIRRNLGYATAFSPIVTDLALALMPILIISKLNLDRKTKYGLIFLMSLGVFNMCAAVVTFVAYHRAGFAKDSTYDGVDTLIWGFFQVSFVHVIASIPFIRPLVANSKCFSWSWYRSLVLSSRYDDTTSEGTTVEPKNKKKGKVHESLPHIPESRFVTTTLRNAGQGMKTDLEQGTSSHSLSTVEEVSTKEMYETNPRP